jgi:hypothetical protein
VSPPFFPSVVIAESATVHNYCFETASYTTIFYDEYIIAYKAVREDYHSVYNWQYKYEVGQTYKSHCDCDLFEENSFGLSTWTKEGALEYYNKGKTYLQIWHQFPSYLKFL